MNNTIRVIFAIPMATRFSLTLPSGFPMKTPNSRTATYQNPKVEDKSGDGMIRHRQISPQVTKFRLVTNASTSMIIISTEPMYILSKS